MYRKYINMFNILQFLSYLKLDCLCLSEVICFKVYEIVRIYIENVLQKQEFDLKAAIRLIYIRLFFFMKYMSFP